VTKHWISTGTAVLVACGALAATAPAAAALSCAPHPDGSPHAIASGTERLSTEARFFETHDYAVLGTVTGIETVLEGPDHGSTTVTVDVTAVLGRTDAPDTVVLSTPDPGWLAGWPYVRGRAYFVPVQDVGPGGEPNFSFLCDPVSEVADPDALADELAPLAEDAGIEFAGHGVDGDAAGRPSRPSGPAGPTDPSGADASSSSPLPAAGPVLGAVTAGGAGLALVAVRAARRRSTDGAA
jgi:hypothetical protein